MTRGRLVPATGAVAAARQTTALALWGTTMTWMTEIMGNDFKTFRGTISPLLGGDYRLWPRWQIGTHAYRCELH